MARDILLADPPLVKYPASGPLTVALILEEWLKGGVTINSVGTPVVTSSVEGDETPLTVTAEEVNDEVHTSRDDGSTTYDVGKVVLYKVSGGTTGARYTVKFPLVLSNGDEPDAKVPWVIL